MAARPRDHGARHPLQETSLSSQAPQATSDGEGEALTTGHDRMDGHCTHEGWLPYTWVRGADRASVPAAALSRSAGSRARAYGLYRRRRRARGCLWPDTTVKVIQKGMEARAKWFSCP